jgi:ATP-dependent helicase/DNAse subunit B
MSIEIESRLDEKPVPWNIIKHQKKHRVEFKIQPDTAKELFLRENKLHGSISSFEKWFNCPASYFLTSGLRLRKQEYSEFNIALMGTLQHAILEEVMSTYHKNINECTEEKLSSIVEKKFAPVIQLFTKKRSFLVVAKNRCTKNMTLIFDFLNEMEKNTDFEPKKMEERFKVVFFDNQPYSIQIQGIIDRIDMTHDMLRVLDYKSSHKSLSASKIQSGLQLQLLTYLYVASELYHKTAAGCYYVSMKNDDIKAPVSKVDGRKLEIVDPDSSSEMDLWKQSHRLDGMTFEDTNMLDFDGTHIKGFKNGRPAKIYTIEDLTGFIQTIYQHLIDQLTNGHIALTPTEDACTFCDHFSICRFHSLKIKSIVPEELTSHFFKEVK